MLHPASPSGRHELSNVALLVIDVQESFRHRPFWDDADVPPFTGRPRTLMDGAAGRGFPVLQVFPVADAGPFSPDSGHVRTLEPIVIAPTRPGRGLQWPARR